MKSVSQIPIRSPAIESNSSTELRPFKADTIYATLRRMKARMLEIESQLAILRRDVARIDRASYRYKATIPGPPGDGQSLEQMIGGISYDGR